MDVKTLKVNSVQLQRESERQRQRDLIPATVCGLIWNEFYSCTQKSSGGRGEPPTRIPFDQAIISQGVGERTGNHKSK